MRTGYNSDQALGWDFVYRGAVTTTQNIKRVIALPLGLLSAIGAMMPVLTLIDDAEFSSKYPEFHSGFWSKVGVGATTAVSIILCVSISYLFLRYAIRGSSSLTGARSPVFPFFAGAALASTAVLILATLSQVVLLCVAVIRLHSYGAVHWTPQMWWAMRDTPASFAAALVLFALVFSWQYRRSIRPHDRDTGLFRKLT